MFLHHFRNSNIVLYKYFIKFRFIFLPPPFLLLFLRRPLLVILSACVYEFGCMRVYSLRKRNKVNVHFKAHIKVMYTIYVLWINEKKRREKKNTFVIQFPSNRINNPLTEIKVLAKLLNVTFDIYSKQRLFDGIGIPRIESATKHLHIYWEVMFVTWHKFTLLRSFASVNSYLILQFIWLN